MANNVVRKRPLHRILLAAGMWLIPVVAVIFGAGNWLPPLASEHGAGIDGILRYLLITVGALLVIGHLVLGYFILRFGGQERVGPFRMPSARTERMWSLVPVVILALVAEGGVLVLGLPVWDKFYASAAPADSVVIEVTAEQFAWNVRYSGPDGKFGPTDPKRITLNEPLGLDRSDPATKDDILMLNEIWAPLGVPVQIRLRSKVVGALIYPIIMAIVGTVIMSILMVAVVPQVTQLFDDAEKVLPWYTQLLIWVSDLIGNRWYLFVTGVPAFFYAALRWTRSSVGKPLWDRFKLWLPIVGPIARQIAIARFARTLGTMLSSGVPLLRALDISKDILGNHVLLKVIEGAREQIQQGE